MNILHHIKKHLSNKTVVHGAMFAFAVTSTLNIAGFFRATQHHWLVASSIGLALGAGLMAVSIYLSKQDTANRQNFIMLLLAAIFMATLSGQIQAMGYRKHGLDAFTAYLLGYAPPFIVEILLALSVSLAERSERERVQRDSKRFIKDSGAEAMTTAFRGVDASRIQKHIERQVDTVIRAFVDDAMHEMLDELQRGHQPGVLASATKENTEPAGSHQIAGFGPDNLPAANEARAKLVAERQATILQLFVTYGAMGVSDLQKRLRDDRSIKASERTLRDDLQAMEADGRLVKIDRGTWEAKRIVNLQLPTPAAPVLNGSH